MDLSASLVKEKQGKIKMSPLFLFLLLLASFAQSEYHTVNVDWYEDYPVSLLVSPGDTVIFYAYTPGQTHWIYSLSPDFISPVTRVHQKVEFERSSNLRQKVEFERSSNLRQKVEFERSSNPFFNSSIGGSFFTYSVKFTEKEAGGSYYFTDNENIWGSTYGAIYVKEPSDIYLNFTVFAGFPALESYPKNITITRGKRVFWDASREPLINHVLAFTDGKFHAIIGYLTPHPFLFNRRSSYFGHRFNVSGDFPYICTVHASMYGVISVV